AMEIWDALYAKGVISVPFCNRKWATCREELARRGIIRIVDRNYGPKQAMKWDVDSYFPFLGLWKGERKRGLLGPGEFGREIIEREKEHNTLLHLQSDFLASVGSFCLPRPPP